ncbi:MAG: class I tRNA ligase family protein, partial [Flavobacteriaceae bacterium]
MDQKFNEYKALNLPEISESILEFWNQENVFEESMAGGGENGEYVFYEGPPSANGMPGIHHVMARTIKDIYPRFKTMKGFRVKRKAGWDTHGLPIELGVEKELGITKEDIGKKISIEEYNEACKKAVMRYTDVWNQLTAKMGYWVDMRNPYITYKTKYMESVWWLLKQIYDKGLLYKGYTVQPYSPKAGTGLSSHELNQPGTYQDVTDTTVTAQFKALKSTLPAAFQAVEEEVYFLAWTTTPWTLPSNTALTVGPKIEYSLVATYNQYTFERINVVIATALISKQFGKKFVEVEDVNELKAFEKTQKTIPYIVLNTVKGEELVEARYEQLMPYVQPYQNPENAFRVISGNFVTTEDGTGIVHTAPTFGADDAMAAKQATPEVPPMLILDENQQAVPLVDLTGKFREELGPFGGKYVKNAYYDEKDIPEKSIDVEIAIQLKIENKAFKVEKYVHSYPNCWRTDKPILYYPLNSWFIKVTAIKDRMHE